jgi:hypothetical protein
MAILGYTNRSQFIRSFGLTEWLRARGVAGWLEIATEGLAKPAKERIASEIGAHYAEAVSVHMAAGEPDISAQTAALTELGDPQLAAKNFQENHLTESEAKWMQSMERMAAQPFFSFRTMSCSLTDIAPLIVAVLLRSPAHQTFIFHVWAISALITFTGFRLVPRLLYAKILSRTAFLKAIALSFHITDFTIGTLYFFALVICKLHKGEVVFSHSDLVFFFLYMNHPGRHIWHKLRKMGDERNDLPPQQPAC